MRRVRRILRSANGGAPITCVSPLALRTTPIPAAGSTRTKPSTLATNPARQDSRRYSPSVID
jgi:hypothetical protein